MVKPVENLDEMVELLHENGYFVEEVWNFSADSPDEFTVGLEVEVLEEE